MLGAMFALFAAGVIFFFFFLLFTIETLIGVKHKIHNYTPPPEPKYRTYCPPPPPEYYLRKEFLHKVESQNLAVNSNRFSNPHSK